MPKPVSPVTAWRSSYASSVDGMPSSSNGLPVSGMRSVTQYSSSDGALWSGGRAGAVTVAAGVRRRAGAGVGRHGGLALALVTRLARQVAAGLVRDERLGSVDELPGLGLQDAGRLLHGRAVGGTPG